MERIRVALVEDHALVREGLRRVLEATADLLVVGEVGDGEEAVSMATRLSPDVVLMDVSLPRLSGIEATRRIKDSHPATAVLMLTAYDDDAYALAALDAGAAGYVLKTARGEELIRAIRVAQTGDCVLSPSVASRLVRLAASSGRSDARSLHIASTEAKTLTDREWEVLHLVARGLTNKEIAASLNLSHRTVQIHLSHIFAKLGVASRTEAVATCMGRGWLRLEAAA